jgi:hypothetical protein
MVPTLVFERLQAGAAVVLLALAVSGCRSKGSTPQARITVACTTQSPTTVSCTASNDGPDPARPCWDVIVTCGGTEHEATQQCVRKLAKGESDAVVSHIAAFEPKIKADLADCTGLHHDELSLQ